MMIEVINGITFCNEYPYSKPYAEFRSDVLGEVPDSFRLYYEKCLNEKGNKNKEKDDEKEIKQLKERESQNDIYIKKFEEIARWDIELDHVSKILDNTPEEYLVGERWFTPLMCILPYIEENVEEYIEKIDNWSKKPTKAQCLAEQSCDRNKEYNEIENQEKYEMVIRCKTLNRYPNTMVKIVNEGRDGIENKQIRSFNKFININSFINLRKYGSRVKTVREYVDAEDIEGPKDIFIVASLGSGKTSAVIKYLKRSKRPFIFVVHLKNLIADIKDHLKEEGIKVKSYDCENFNKTYWNDDGNTNWIVSYNSLHKIAEREINNVNREATYMTRSFEDYTVILDEFKSSIEYLYTASTFGKTRIRCIYTLKEIFRTSKKMVLMDGNMSDDEINVYNKWRKEGMDYVILNSTMRNFGGKEAIQIREYEEMKNLIKKEAMYTPAGCYVCCNLREPMYDLYNEVIGHIKDQLNVMKGCEKERLKRVHGKDDLERYLTERVMYIASDTDRLRSEYSGNVNKKWKNKVIITTPSIVEGISYVSETPIITYCISLLGRTLTPPMKCQQLCRSRNCYMLVFYIDYKLTPHNMIYLGMPVHKSVEDCCKTYDFTDITSSYNLNKIQLKSKEICEINEDMMNRMQERVWASEDNDILMKIIYKQDIQLLCYEYYYIKYLKRLGFKVIRNYEKEVRAIKKDDELKRCYSKHDVMKFLKSRDMLMEKEMKELGIAEDMDEKTYDKTVGKLALTHTQELHEKVYDSIDMEVEKGTNSYTPTIQEQYTNRIRFYLRMVPTDEMKNYFKMKYKTMLLGREGYKHDIDKAATKVEDPLDMHNKIIAFLMNQCYLENVLNKIIRKDNPLNYYKSVYTDMYMVKRLIREGLGHNEVEKMGYLDTRKISEEEIEISESLSRFFKIPRQVKHKQLVNLVRRSLIGLWTSKKCRYVIDGKKYCHTVYELDRDKIKYHIDFYRLRMKDSDVFESFVKEGHTHLENGLDNYIHPEQLEEFNRYLESKKHIEI
eukprot:766183-Hanusia_phi.AAC.1